MPNRPIQPLFPTGRLGASPIRQTLGLNDMVKYYTSWPQDCFQCLMCFTCPIMPSNASIPEWPVGSNGVFLTDRLGVSQMMHISRKDYLYRNNPSGPHTWSSMFDVPYRPIQPPFLSGRLGVMIVPHWPVGKLPYKTDIGIELYG